MLTSTYADGEVVSDTYDSASGRWTGVSTTQGGTTTTLLAGAIYTGPDGASGELTGAAIGNGTYQYAATYDNLLRLTGTKLTRSSDQVTMFEQARGFDTNGDVVTLATTLPQGSDQQQFCYDDLSRLTWAGSTASRRA